MQNAPAMPSAGLHASTMIGNLLTRLGPTHTGKIIPFEFEECVYILLCATGLKVGEVCAPLDRLMQSRLFPSSAKLKGCVHVMV